MTLIESASGMLRFSTLADRIIPTLFEIAKDPATNRAELAVRVRDLRHEKLPQSIISKLNALNRTLMWASFRDLLTRSGRSLLSGLKGLFNNATIRRLPSFLRTVWSYPQPTREKIKKGYGNLMAGLKEMSPFILEQFHEAAIIAPKNDRIALKHPGEARHEIEIHALPLKPVKRMQSIKRKSRHDN